MDRTSWIARAALAAWLLAALSGCGPSLSPNTYSASATQQANKVDRGTVVGVRRVDVVTSGAVGAATGGAAGGVAGSTAPGGVGSAFGAIGGALIGGLVGTGVERATTEMFAYEYIVRKSSGDLVSVTQKDAKPLAVGTKVLVISGSQARIVQDYTVSPDEAKSASAQPAANADAAPAPAAQPTATQVEPPPAPVTATPLAPLPPLTPFTPSSLGLPQS
jgi:outer membrane lipoprotein SlyB